MKLDFKEIAKSWYNKFNHSPELKKLADERFNICLECPSKQEVFEGKKWSLRCIECGCPLSGKIYTPNTYLIKNGSCPLGKWKDVEDEYIKSFKKIKTIL